MAEFQVAAPSYLKAGEKAASPSGHRFGLYFAGWSEKWEAMKQSGEVLQQVTKIDKTASKMCASLIKRQQILRRSVTDPVLHLPATTTARFVTGMGIEHPIENGFAFLTPYGLPYLPGSSVKGVLRRAAEELALIEPEHRGWTLLDVWWLFGFDAHADMLNGPRKGRKDSTVWKEAYERASDRIAPQAQALFARAVLEPADLTDIDPSALLNALRSRPGLKQRIHLRGALSFWDVFPDLSASESGLEVDIMNPHHGDYYREQEAPGDWENPVPVYYLTIARNTPFLFHVSFRPPASAPDDLAERWRPLLQAAFEHAFNWLGFGGKTSQGYGSMKVVENGPGDAEEDEETAGEGSLSPKVLEAIERLKDPETEEEEINRICNQVLTSLEGAEAFALAEALKAAYTRIGKWDDKDAGRRHKKRIKEIQRILEEE